MAKTILLADDEPYILHVLAMKLRNAGYDVITAGDGEEALTMCLQENPDLIITDFQMPRYSGLQVCKEYFQKSQRYVPAILITAREFDLQDEEVANSGVSMVIGKPFSPRQIVRHVQSLLKDVPVEVTQTISEIE